MIALRLVFVLIELLMWGVGVWLANKFIDSRRRSHGLPPRSVLTYVRNSNLPEPQLRKLMFGYGAGTAVVCGILAAILLSVLGVSWLLTYPIFGLVFGMALRTGLEVGIKRIIDKNEPNIVPGSPWM